MNRFEDARAFRAGGRITDFRLGEPPLDLLHIIEAAWYELRAGRFDPTTAVYGPYTPAEELLDRLNTRAQGKDPGAPINWKGIP